MESKIEYFKTFRFTSLPTLEDARRKLLLNAINHILAGEYDTDALYCLTSFSYDINDDIDIKNKTILAEKCRDAFCRLLPKNWKPHNIFISDYNEIIRVNFRL